MEIWKELLGTYEGQLSLAVIICTLIMAGYFARLFIKNAMQPPPTVDNEKNKSEHTTHNTP